ncbi:MAG: hypothetical protein EA393_14625, partial [Bacteroidetes bacterium]
ACGASQIQNRRISQLIRIMARLRELKILWILNCKFNDVQSGIANSAQQGPKTKNCLQKTLETVLFY